MQISVKCFILVSLFSTSLSAADPQKAIQDAIVANKDCKKLGDFYWEIGDARGKVISGAEGNTYNADTTMKMASASKWLFGAYVFEKLKGRVTDEQKEFLQMRSGYTNMSNLSCLRDKIQSVKDCFLAEPKMRKLFGKAGNAALISENKGKFYYNGAHAQALAVKEEIGLADKNNTALAQAIKSSLKLENISYFFPQLAGGAKTNAGTYAEFLRNLMNDKYFLGKTLQSEPGVCANSSCGSKDVTESPVADHLPWWYANHYWIEKNQKGMIEAYSSPGLFGFYPWISADKKYYGIIAREGTARDRGVKSISCGDAIRKAFFANRPRN